MKAYLFSRVSSFALFILSFSIFGLAGIAQPLKAQTIKGMGIANKSDHVYAWYSHRKVISGSSGKLNRYRKPYNYKLPPGKSTRHIVGMGIAANNHVYVWYSDGTVSSGTSSNLSTHRKPYKYSLPPGKTPKDIVGMGIAKSNDHVYAWYSDGTVSSGTSRNLDAYRKPYRYSLPPRKKSKDILGMGIATNDHVYVWYSNGTVSSGTSRNLDAYRSLYKYSGIKKTPPPRTTTTISCGELPKVPSYIRLAESTSSITIDFSSRINGYPTITIPRDYFHDLPSCDGEIIFPNNFCGFKVKGVRSFQWMDRSGKVLGEVNNNYHRTYNSVKNVQSIPGNHYFEGIDFFGPFEGCSGNYSGWSFPQPLTKTGKLDYSLKDVILELNISGRSSIEFLNYKISPGKGLKPNKFFKKSDFSKMGKIVKEFKKKEKEKQLSPEVFNRYEKIVKFIDLTCINNPSSCPY